MSVPAGKEVAVIGAGEMGHGIAELFAISGYAVRLCDVDSNVVKAALDRVKESLQRLADRGRIGESPDTVLSRITAFTSIEEACKGVTAAVEAVPERLELKKNVFERMDRAAPAEALLATNTSNIRITDIAKGLKHPERVVGLHFFNPPVIMKLVEIISGETTDSGYIKRAAELAAELRKTPVLVGKDRPGFIVNRINAADMLYFGMLLQQGIVTPASADMFMREQGLPMGPYELIDFVGVDTVSNSLAYFSVSLEPEFSKCTIFSDMVKRGLTGRKGGRGFYEWKDGKAIIPQEKPTDRISLMELFSIEINETAKLIEEGVAVADDIENAVRLGMNRPFGPVTAAKGMTAQEIVSALNQVSSSLGIAYFRPTKSIQEGKLHELLSRKRAEAPPPGGRVILSKEGRVATLKLDHPPLNTIDASLLESLEEAVNRIKEDREIRAVIITSNGSNFSAGAELSSFFRHVTDFVEYARKGERIMKEIATLDAVTLAVLRGYVLGGGLELALACDLRVATPDALLGFPEVSRGLIPAWGGVDRLPRLIGQSRAAQLILTSKNIRAEEAAQWGLVNILSKEPENEASSLASHVAENLAPVAISLAKRALSRTYEMSSGASNEMEALSAGVLFGTQDLKEGISSFLQKRKPEFSGR
ncbi:MAG: 3-hydroxyacyl-CoA dehydrogenase NAD-binding domain-containing protein [Methanomassiliicoccales archaeon]